MQGRRHQHARRHQCEGTPGVQRQSWPGGIFEDDLRGSLRSEQAHVELVQGQPKDERTARDPSTSVEINQNVDVNPYGVEIIIKLVKSKLKFDAFQIVDFI